MKPRHLLSASLGLLMAASFPCPAQESDTRIAPEGKTLIQPPSVTEESKTRGPIVKDIVIEFAGSQSVDRSLILSNMRTTVGQPYSPNAVQEDVRNLYATGQFVNLRIYDEPLENGVRVVVIVQPKAAIKQIIITGTEKISESAVRKKIKSRPGEPLSEQQIAEDARTIRTYYQDKGFHNATVEYKFDVNEQVGRAVVTFTIREETKAFVRNVDFVNATAYETKELRKLFKTRKKNMLSFINKSGIFKQEQLDEDLKKLRDHYYQGGYIDFAVQDIRFAFPEEGVMDVTVEVFEGIPYSVGSLSFENNQLFTREQILGRLSMREGGVFSPQGLEGDIKAMKDLYGENGYIDTNVNAVRQPNIESGKMDLLYQFTEGPQSFVQKIIIQGNDRTKDKVLRREMAVAPGDVYDTVRVEASKKRLENLGYFSKVDANPQDTAVPNRKDLVVTVEEQRTGSVTFGAGFSTVDSILGFVEVSQGNFDYANWPSFTGGGQKFRARAQYGLRRQDFLLSWTEPWFLDRQISFGFDAFYNDAQYYSSDYDMRRYGGAVRVGKALDQFWRIGMRYQFEYYDIYNVDDDASDLIKDEEGKRNKSSVRGTVTYDSRDDLYLTRSGEKVEFAAEGAGGPLLGDTKIWKLEAEATKYWSLPYDMILMLGVATAVVDTYDSGDEAVPLFDRLFIGGSKSIRGFKYRDVGPQDDGDPVGGKTMAYSNLEVTFPIMDRVRGAVFVDAGFNENKTFEYTLDNLNVGTGIGLRLNLPIGPLRFDLGFPVITDRYHDVGDMEFHFDVGYQF